MKIQGKMKVKTLKSDFNDSFGLTLRIYDGKSFADDNATVASIRKGTNKGGDLAIKRNIKVGNLEDKILEMFEIKTQISGSDDSYLCNNDLTLAAALLADTKKMERKEKKSNKIVANNEVKGNSLISIEEVLIQVKNLYSDHEDFDEMISDLSDDEYLEHWAEKLCDDEFDNNKELSSDLFTVYIDQLEDPNAYDYASLGAKISDSSKLNNKEWGRELFIKAISLATRTNELASIAEDVLEADGLNDKEWARELFIKAISSATQTNELVSIAKGVLDANGLNDKEWARELFIKAISLATGTYELVNIAEAVSDEDGLNDKSLAAKICEEAELNVKDLYDYNNLIDVLFDFIEDKKWAINVAKKAHKKCIEITDDNIEGNEFGGDGSEMLALAQTLFSSERCADEEGAKDIFEKLKYYQGVTPLLDAARLNTELYDDEYSKKYSLTIVEKALGLLSEGYYCDVYLFIRDELHDEEKASQFMDNYESEIRNDGFIDEDEDEDEGEGEGGGGFDFGAYEKQLISESLDSIRKCTSLNTDEVDFDDYNESRSVLRITLTSLYHTLANQGDFEGFTEEQADLAFYDFKKQVIPNLVSAVYELFNENVEERILMAGDDEGIYEYEAAINMIGNEITSEAARLFFVITKDLPQDTINELLLKLSEQQGGVNGIFLGNEDQILYQSYDDGEFDTGYFQYGEDYLDEYKKNNPDQIKNFKNGSEMLLNPSKNMDRTKSPSMTDPVLTSSENLMSLANEGDAEAQFQLGLIFRNGDGVVKDDKQAVVWYKKAAEQGHANAQQKLGFMYFNGLGILEDNKLGVAWYKKAAEQGVVKAQANLGLIFQNGYGVVKDDKEAGVWYKKAAEQGLAPAQFNLALMFANGDGVVKDDKSAFFWFKKAAEQGDEDAQYNVGIMLECGNGVVKDGEEAFVWYKKAAEQGHAKAQYNLGAMYSNGRVVLKDEKEAEIWFAKAAEQGVDASCED